MTSIFDINPAGTRDDDTRRFDILWLLSIIVLALGLRLPMLNASLWFDEIDTLVNFVRLPLPDLVTSYPSLNNHMFFSVQAKLATAAFGESPWTLRLPALVFGLGSIWALWLLGRDVLGRWEGNFAALLMAVSYHHVWFSQNARGYTGLLFWGLLATLLLVRGHRSARLLPWIGYGLCFAASMYTHLSAGFLFAAHAVAYLCLLGARAIGRTDRLPFLNPLVGGAFGIGVTLALYWPILTDVLATFTDVATEVQPEAFATSIAQFKNPLWTGFEALSSLTANGLLAVAAVPVIAAPLLAATIALLRRQSLFALVLPVHVPLTIALLMLIGMRIWPRYFFVDIGIICLLLVYGAGLLGAFFASVLRWPTPGLMARVFVLIGVAASLVLLPKNYRYPKQDFAGAAAFVEAERTDWSSVITLGLTRHPFEQYYAPSWLSADSLTGFQALLAPGQETWVVYTFPDITERRHADILASVQGEFEKVRFFPGTLGGGGIVVLKSTGESQ